jgi:hypothetical protein
MSRHINTFIASIRDAVRLTAGRRKYIPVGLRAASLLPTPAFQAHSIAR